MVYYYVKSVDNCLLIHQQGPGFIYRPQSEQNLIDGRMTSAHYSLENSNVTVINACDLFKQPLRGSRPDHIVVILRGLPGLLEILLTFLLLYY